MQAYKSAVFALVVFALGTLPAWAQDAQTVEVTPYVALGSDMASPVGAAITFPIKSKLSFETDAAYRRAEGNINALSLSASLLYDLPRIGRATPYVAAGIGLAKYGTPVEVVSPNGRQLGTRSRLAMTVNAGGGLKMPMNEKMGLRTDARWFNFLGEGSEGFRVSQGISFGLGKR
jgi:opacity protein-like surface antigen